MVFSRYMVDSIAVAAFVDDAGLDGLPTYGAVVVHDRACRIEERTRTVRREDGTTVDVETACATRVAIGERDRIWLAPFAGNDAPRTFPPGYVFSDANARTPKVRNHARRRRGNRGHSEFFF